MAGTARDEAERLVAAVLAMARSDDRLVAGLGALGETVSGFLGNLTASDGEDRPSGSHRGGAWATGSAECCVCPICRVISTMRDPSPETAAKLAIGAGDLAAGVASMMRAFSAVVGERTAPKPPPAARPHPENRDENWSAATRTTTPAGDAAPAAAGASSVSAEPGRDDGAAAVGTDPGTGVGTSPAGADPGAGAGTPPAGADPWAAATSVSAARAAAEHAAEVEARAARRAAEQAAQREAARAAARRAKEAADRVAEAVRLADAARDLDRARQAGESREAGGAGSREAGGADAAGGVRPGPRTPRKRDVWAAATADAGVAAVGGEATLDHGVQHEAVPGTVTPVERDRVAGDDARDHGAA